MPRLIGLAERAAASEVVWDTRQRGSLHDFDPYRSEMLEVLVAHGSGLAQASLVFF